MNADQVFVFFSGKMSVSLSLFGMFPGTIILGRVSEIEAVNYLLLLFLFVFTLGFINTHTQ
jgi:hypothetical protein